MNITDPSGIVDPNARDKAGLPPLPGCYGRPPMPDVGSIVVENIGKALKKKPRKR